jgi:predicted PurR-regulated permease PerM
VSRGTREEEYITMGWMTQARVALGRKGGSPPPFPTPPVIAVDRPSTVDDGLPRGIRIGGAWAWRIILFIAAGYLLLRLLGVLRIVVIPVVVALLLAALFEPAAAALRRRRVNRSLAAGVVLVGGLLVVGGGLGLIVRTFVAQFDDLSDQVGQGVDEVKTWLGQGPLHLSQEQLDDGVERLRQSVSDNQGALTSGAVSTATTLGEVLAGFFVVLFTLFFFLRDGGQIWRFVCRLLPGPAQVPVARAGHYSWHTLVSYVRATVLVAFVDAVGIGIGLVVLGVPLALPLAALVFLGGFIPVVGATVSGAVAVLVALVTVGPVKALILLAVVIAVQQLEGHVLQPLIMGRAVALHPLAVILAIATGVVTAGIVGGLVAVPLLAIANTAIRYLAEHPSGEPTADRTTPGTEPTDRSDRAAEHADEEATERADPQEPPAVDTSLDPPALHKSGVAAP